MTYLILIQIDVDRFLDLSRVARIGRALYFREDAMEIDEGLDDQVSQNNAFTRPHLHLSHPSPMRRPLLRTGVFWPSTTPRTIAVRLGLPICWPGRPISTYIYLFYSATHLLTRP